MPTAVPLSSSPYLADNADDFRDGLSELQNFTCPDVEAWATAVALLLAR